MKQYTTSRAKIFLSGALLVFGMFSALAQESVSLQEAIQKALANKAEAKKAALQIQKAEYKITEARAGALPQVHVGGNLTYNPIIQESVLDFGGQRMVVKMGQPWTSNIAATVNQALFDQKVFIGLKAAKSTREFYVLNATLTNEQIISNVATSYYNVFVQEENLRTLDASYANTEKVRNIIKSLVDNGLAKQIDLDRTNVQLTNISSNKQRVVNGVELAKNALKFYMGIPIDTDIELQEESIEPKPELLASIANIDNRSEVKVLEKQKELLQFNKKATEAALYPTVGLQGQYGFYGMGNKFPLTNGSNNGVNWSDFASIGLNVNIPIFTGGATKARIQQADIDILDVEQDIENTKQSLNLDYKNSVTNIENALINLNSMKDNVELAEKVQKNTQSNYQYGLANLTELLDSENALTQAKQNYANALLDYKQAEIQLIKAKGELNTLTQP
ncbi:TolC family protein [Soonwooa sp.]|uniref:TolC family protein n=1 Tax=Soonwooa sp. TaxID=1938592 RepID=UPI0028AE0DA1|nr:TolC family protein [Soonwooa sp.]